VDDLWLDIGLDELFLGTPGDFGAPAGEGATIVGGSYPSYRRKKRTMEEPPAIKPWNKSPLYQLALAREGQKIERERQGQIAAVRDMNLQKAQAANAEKRDRQDKINKERLKNLEKARKAKR
jgi:hypothetical protein